MYADPEVPAVVAGDLEAQELYYSRWELDSVKSCY